MNKKTFDIIVKHKIEKVCKLYFGIQEQYQDEFEEMGELFDGDWIRMTQYATGEWGEIDGDDMTLNNVLASIGDSAVYIKDQLEKNGKIDKNDLEECQFIYDEIEVPV